MTTLRSKFYESQDKKSTFFDYDKTKFDFYVQMNDIISENDKKIPSEQIQIWTKKTINACIEDILLEDMHEVLHRIYSTTVIKGERKLFKNGLEIITWDNCFDIILDVHRKEGHNKNWQSNYEKVSEKYVISEICFATLVQACTVCRDVIHPISNPIQFNKKCQVYTLCMESQPDPPFDKIILLVDRMTSFVHLRPVIGSDKQYIATELLKIFTDFGVPLELMTYETLYLNEISDIIQNILGVKIMVTIDKNDLNDLTTNWKDRAYILLKEWLDVTGSSKWSLGCHFVQWQMNTNIGVYVRTPFELVFEHKENFAPKERRRNIPI
ncbi:unnamed protein product [Diatraea saccharalis]|uniref:Integrase catalytic domain-containing protein n=1 Tax=Diatraea saccharalis TaxID=40085 RepID=A0A9N9R9U9_9NEOP|nr:unnamed protein product [Diatraea saccharalis]